MRRGERPERLHPGIVTQEMAAVECVIFTGESAQRRARGDEDERYGGVGGTSGRSAMNPDTEKQEGKRRCEREECEPGGELRTERGEKTGDESEESEDQRALDLVQS